MPFPLHTPETAPPEARAALEATRRDFGMVPNLEATLASAPPVLKGYKTLWDLFDETTLSPVERQVVYMVANFENNCEYCVPWHSLLAEKAGLDAASIQALREGAPLADPRLEALARFARALVAERGNIAPAALRAFQEAGYSDAQALEVVLGLAVKTISNYANSVAGTPLDGAVTSRAWTKPRIAMRKAGDA